MTDDHKAKLAEGREQGDAVRKYLEALRNNKPTRGRKRTTESITKQLADIEAELPTASPLDELKLLQKRRDLQAALDNVGSSVDITALEAAFVAIAKAYSQRQGITYATWREVGVDAKVLRDAGISRAG